MILLGELKKLLSQMCDSDLSGKMPWWAFLYERETPSVFCLGGCDQEGADLLSIIIREQESGPFLRELWRREGEAQKGRKGKL